MSRDHEPEAPLEVAVVLRLRASAGYEEWRCLGGGRFDICISSLLTLGRSKVAVAVNPSADSRFFTLDGGRRGSIRITGREHEGGDCDLCDRHREESGVQRWRNGMGYGGSDLQGVFSLPGGFSLLFGKTTISIIL